MRQRTGHCRQPLVFAHLVPTLLDVLAAVLGLHLDCDRIAQKPRDQAGDALRVVGLLTYHGQKVRRF